MKTFCKLTTDSPASSYVPLPGVLLQDEALLQLFAGRLPAAGRHLPAGHFPQPDLPVVPPRRAAGATEAGTGNFQPQAADRCESCGRSFLTRSGRAKYCRECAAKIHSQQKAESARKRRYGADK